MKTKKIANYLCAAIVILSFSLAGCGGGAQPAQTAGPAEKKANGSIRTVEENGKKVSVVKLSYGDSFFPQQSIVTDEKGFFAEQGIKIEWVGVIPSGQLINAVIAGDIATNSGIGHMPRLLNALDAGAKLKAVANSYETTQTIPHMIGIVRKDSGLKKASDLAAKGEIKIGILKSGGCNDYTGLEYVRKNGGVTDPKAKIKFFTVPTNKGLEQAVRQKDIDLALLHKSQKEIDRNEFDILYTDYDIWGTLGGACPYYFTEDNIKQHPDVIRRFVAAIGKGANWADEHPEETKAITAKVMNLEAKQMNDAYFTKDAIVDEVTVDIWIDILKHYGELKNDIKASNVYTNEFNPYYKKA